MKTINLTAKLNKNSTLTLNKHKYLTTQNKLNIEKILNSTNQSIYTNRLIINNVKEVKLNEFTFTVQYVKSLTNDLQYALISLIIDDLDDLKVAYTNLQREIKNVKLSKFNKDDLNYQDEDIQINVEDIFSSEEISNMKKTHYKYQKNLHKFNTEEEFKKNFDLTDSQFTALAQIF